MTVHLQIYPELPVKQIGTWKALYLVGWFVCWLVCLLVGWLVGWLVAWLFSWFLFLKKKVKYLPKVKTV